MRITNPMMNNQAGKHIQYEPTKFILHNTSINLNQLGTLFMYSYFVQRIELFDNVYVSQHRKTKTSFFKLEFSSKHTRR